MISEPCDSDPRPTSSRILKSSRQASQRFGIAEIYGQDFAKLPAEKLRQFAVVSHTSQPCPFRGAQCRKKRGVCSLRLYEKGESVAPLPDSPLVNVCPERFKEGGIIKRWVSEILLGTVEPAEVFEVDFLQGPPVEDDEGEPQYQPRRRWLRRASTPSSMDGIPACFAPSSTMIRSSRAT